MGSKTELMDVFLQLAAEKAEVKLINNYKGIPVSNEATVEELDDIGVILRVSKNQCVCLELERFTYIQNPALPTVIKARVESLDFLSLRVKLTGFEYAPETIGRRTALRVQPKSPLDVLIIYQSQKIRGSLADISSMGIGIYMLSAYIYDAGMLRKGEAIQVHIRLPFTKGGWSEVRLPGTIRYINRDKGLFRLGIDTDPEMYVKTQISRYIDQRQAETLRELRVLFDTFYRLKQEGKG